jgi:hypothetical protein
LEQQDLNGIGLALTVIRSEVAVLLDAILTVLAALNVNRNAVVVILEDVADMAVPFHLPKDAPTRFRPAADDDLNRTRDCPLLLPDGLTNVRKFVLALVSFALSAGDGVQTVTGIHL